MPTQMYKQYGKRTYTIRVAPNGVSGWRAVASVGHMEGGVFFTDFSKITGLSGYSADDAWVRAEAQVLTFIDKIDS
ncbi:hypothetical protein HUS70_02450 [Pandoraea nosoerga]|uniref:Uncharacterized protein n=2 Tax=Pandoraea TaxID=93217 RepID=A0A5E4T692_9BURK|nr:MULTISPECIES: hypothetical protein [Pandoraea]MBN4664367.1 hypothetical protein [Pandoraea nosoerga]MBN4675737.1 hypothetical protein [Pandoraea nosoerga]MBN4679456.1 hypothetical protein [Pandoraea nosoerga]MBN4743547.1 hypothetical protein [Pandoraea nosoerga]SUA91829.1 Uncharacterised protein [Pandoraea pulmonicola]